MSERLILEAHAHTKEVSACSWLPAEELVRGMKEKGVGALVVTDHYLPGKFTSLEKREGYLSGYRKAREEGEKIGVKVLLGAEMRFSSGDEDFLVYGMEEEDVLNLPDDVCEAGLRAFHDMAREKGWMVYQAHPYRPGLKAAPHHEIDGVEIFNACPRQHSQNRLAASFASRFQLHTIAGGDVHWMSDIGLTGIAVPQEALETSTAFARWLKNTPHPAIVYQETPVDGIRYTVGTSPNMPMLMDLYRDAGWTAYLDDPKNSMAGVMASRRLVTAWDDTTLVGLARSVGDGKTIVYVQDLLVMSAYRRRGIGKGLMRRLLQGENVRQTVLIADDSPWLRNFYKACGFENVADYHCAGFIKVNRE